MGETNRSRQETIRGMVLGVDRSVFKAEIKSHKNAFKNARGDSPQIHQYDGESRLFFFMGETNRSRQETIRGMVLGVDRSVFKAEIKSHKNAFKNARGDPPRSTKKIDKLWLVDFLSKSQTWHIITARSVVYIISL